VAVKSLTARQREVLLLVAAGCTGEQIGRRLGVRSTTVTRHLTGVYRYLGAQDRAHAVALAIHHGHITLAELARIAAPKPAHNSGPTIAEAAADDDAHWNTKYDRP
jgi:DNA-binding CsgD family transcriptional regulator